MTKKNAGPILKKWPGKRKKSISKIYFPIYWVFSFITLSFLYRPLVHNFLDNKFGRRISILLVPIYILLLVITSFGDRTSNYFEKDENAKEYYSDYRNYEDMLTEEGEFIKLAAIPSKVIRDDFLKVFMVFDDAIEDRMFKRNKGLKPEKDKRGFYSDIVFTTQDIDRKKIDSLKRVYIKTFNNTYKVYIDTNFYDADFILGKSNTKEFGFETYIDIKQLTEGRHTLSLRRDSYNKKDTTEVSFATIPFWHFKE